MAIGTIPPHLRGRVVVDDFGEGAMGLHGCVSGASRIAHKGVSVIQCADGGLYQPTPRVAEYLARCGVAVGWAASPMPRVDVGGA